MNWGKSIVLAFVLFIAFIATLVTVCVREDVNLVTKDYYKEELAYQKQIDRINKTAMLEVKPAIQLEQGQLKVIYSDFDQMEEGHLLLFRPSDPALDKIFELSKSKVTAQYFSTAGMQKGLYRARLTWSFNGQEFFLEQAIQL